jgi:succinate dehydrogenase flavin-adding protein (antitoxin of CptAB toxin-antitoxin module)
MDRIRWHCRRGLLELDLVLTRFLERNFTTLSPDQRAAFEALLEYPDNDLWDLVAGRTQPHLGPAAAVVKLLRDG